MKNAINKQWHETHRLGMPTTLQQRVQWHEQHLKHCGCRKDLPKTIVAALKAQGKKVCSRGHIFSGAGSCPICWPGKSK
jgi:hypothetical protein